MFNGGQKWRVLKNRTKSCHGPAHWKEKLVLGSPPHHWLRNLSTSWHAGLWDVCRMREAVVAARGSAITPPMGTPGADGAAQAGLGPSQLHDEVHPCPPHGEGALKLLWFSVSPPSRTMLTAPQPASLPHGVPGSP